MLPFRFVAQKKGFHPRSMLSQEKARPSHSKFYDLLETSFTAGYDGRDGGSET